MTASVTDLHHTIFVFVLIVEDRKIAHTHLKRTSFTSSLCYWCVYVYLKHTSK